jgi:hypothetical protein
MSTTLTGGAISTVYKKIAFTKATSGSAGDLFYTQDADGVTDIALTTLTSPLTFSGLSTFSEGIKLASGKFILDSGDNEAIGVTTTGSAINYLQVVPSAADNAVSLTTAGGDTHIGLTLDAKGSGVVTCTPDLVLTADIIVGGLDIKTGNKDSSTTAISLSGADTTLAGTLVVEADAATIGGSDDIGDKSLIFRHDAAKTIMGIDDTHDRFVINADNSGAFDATAANNDFSIDTTGNAYIKGDLTVTGNDIKSSSATAITLSGANVSLPGTLTVAENLIIAGGKDIRIDTSATGMDIHNGTTAYISFASAGTTFSSNKTVVLAGTTTISGVCQFTGNVGNTPGTGITGGSNTVCKVWTERFGAMVKTTLYIDLTDLQSNGATGAVIGVNGTGNPCYLTQITSGINGTIVSGRMSCLELPAGGDTDINLSFSTDADDVEADALTDNTVLVDRTAAWAVNDVKAFTTATQVITPNDYLYLVTGDTASDSTYTGGKFLIEIWGTA